MEQKIITRFKGLDYGQAIEKFADELAKCTSLGRQQEVFRDGNLDLELHFGKCKTTNQDATMLINALAKRGIDYKRFPKIFPPQGIIRATDEIER